MTSGPLKEKKQKFGVRPCRKSRVNSRSETAAAAAGLEATSGATMIETADTPPLADLAVFRPGIGIVLKTSDRHNLKRA